MLAFYNASPRRRILQPQSVVGCSGPTKDYEDIPVSEQMEGLSLNGDSTLDESGKPRLHLHTVLGRCNGSLLAGILRRGTFAPHLKSSSRKLRCICGASTTQSADNL
jgi:hypothetical protein